MKFLIALAAALLLGCCTSERCYTVPLGDGVAYSAFVRECLAQQPNYWHCHDKLPIRAALAKEVCE